MCLLQDDISTLGGKFVDANSRTSFKCGSVNFVLK